MSHPSRLRLGTGATVVAITAITMLLMLALPAAATAASRTGCLSRTNTTYQALLECVTLNGVRAHQAALQAIANANEGTRAAGTTGYTKSVDYVSGLLKDAGLQRDIQSVPVRLRRRDVAATTHTCQRELRDGSIHGPRHRRRHRERHLPWTST